MKRVLALSLVLLLMLAGCSSGGGIGSDSGSIYGTPGPAATGVAQEGVGKIDVYSIEIIGVKMAKTKEGKDAAIVEYKWTNGEKGKTTDVTAFFYCFHTVAKQNGTDCEQTTDLSADDAAKYDMLLQQKNINPGDSLNVYVAYIVPDKSDITIKVNDFFFRTRDVVTKVLSLQ
jgi:hypothetical protein